MPMHMKYKWSTLHFQWKISMVNSDNIYQLYKNSRVYLREIGQADDQTNRIHELFFITKYENTFQPFWLPNMQIPSNFFDYQICKHLPNFSITKYSNTFQTFRLPNMQKLSKNHTTLNNMVYNIFVFKVPPLCPLVLFWC